ncbi:hypothetical protein acsn021_35530 [Anaerocolumna cellulosilytica]|uniref:Uncharacterized protein n=1 Tax=Anaerocolumna cellulosilytica TaxID=433286 RepID=A0A6S6QZA5_9FIRM|nr:hypothetical protein [Anaerocolumna cellulosilytica]MBB5195451.1 hypothetical protein [Anaerocolumna cellulosilytica]BCJ95984.1 hypothetical protein acsn021_35530 [Anaerocolumna cellulosilytica]
MKTKVISIIMTCIVLASLFVMPVSASATLSVDKQLERKGYPADVISTMCDEVKNEIISHPDSRYAGSTTVSGDMESTISKNQIIPYGTIPSADLRLTFTGTTYKENGYKILWVTLNYDWEKHIMWYLTDQIGITWDSSKFQVVDGAYGFVNNWYNFTGYNTWTRVVDNNYDARELNAANIIGDIDLKMESPVPYNNRGYAYVKLRVKDGVTAPTSTQAFGKYGHNTIVPTISLTIDSSGLGISASGAATVDTLAISKTFSTTWN